MSVGGWSSVPLYDLVSKELAPYAEEAGRLVMEGPLLHLKPKAALALGMVLHELATNAAKHGALSAPGGRVTVSWREEGADGTAQLVLRWVESGGPPVVAHPERRGFGSELIERQLRHDLRGTIEIVYEPSGLRAVLTLLASIVAHPHAPLAGGGHEMPTRH